MTKSTKNVKELNAEVIAQVEEARNMNTPKVFNLELALKAASNMSAPTSRAKGNTSELGKNIVALLESAGKAMSCKQIAEALQAGGMQITAKNVCDKAWALEKKGLIKKTETGIYAALNV
ncbi:MAG: hypothetical protein IKO49_01560 [Bacilli bacterium]|nr:hypothetical protein [Clostridia bacterium]MBR4617987.1 hypothetical protein [Bacilli bacterium]